MRKLLEATQKVQEADDKAKEERLFDAREKIASALYPILDKAYTEIKKEFPQMTDQEFYEMGHDAMESFLLHADFLDLS